MENKFVSLNEIHDFFKSKLGDLPCDVQLWVGISIGTISRLEKENKLLKSKLESAKETLLQIKDSIYSNYFMCDVELTKIEDMK